MGDGGPARQTGSGVPAFGLRICQEGKLRLWPMLGFFLPQMVGRTDQPPGKVDYSYRPLESPLGGPPHLLPLPPPMSLLPPQLSPYALLPALARLFYTRTPMRRSSCLLECQVNPWDPLVLLNLGHLWGPQFQGQPDEGHTKPVTHKATPAPAWSFWLNCSRLVSLWSFWNVSVWLFCLSNWDGVEASTGKSGAPTPGWTRLT